MEEDDRDIGNVEFWLTDSEDDEVRKPNHGAYFVMKKAKEARGGNCFMVNSFSSVNRGHFSNEGAKSHVFLYSKSIRDYVAESKDVIDKVHSIIESLNIHISRYIISMISYKNF